MDGVVVTTERHWSRYQHEYILPNAIEQGNIDHDRIVGMNVDDQYDYLSSTVTLSVDRNGFVGLYDDVAEAVYKEDAELCVDVPAIAQDLNDAGVSVGLASSSLHRWIDMALEEFGLKEYFDVVVSAEDIEGQSKPSPTIYRYAADQLSVEPKQAIAIEDSRHGIDAANAAGMTTIGLLTEANSREIVSGADFVKEPDELPITIEEPLLDSRTIET